MSAQSVSTDGQEPVRVTGGSECDVCGALERQGKAAEKAGDRAKAQSCRSEISNHPQLRADRT